MHGSQVMHTVRVHNPRCTFHKHTHDTQDIKDIWMHAWYPGDIHCSSPLCRVYILTCTYTCHPILPWQTSGCTRDSQELQTNRVHVHKCICRRIQAILKLPFPIRMYTWFTSDALCSSSQKCIYRHTPHIHTTYSTNAHTYYSTHYRRQEAYVVHKWWTLLESSIPCVYPIYTQTHAYTT